MINDALHVRTRINGIDRSAGETIPVRPGETLAIEMTFLNTGDRRWDRCSHKLGSEHPRDNKTFGRNRVNLNVSGEFSYIHPSEETTFVFTATMPADEGTYSFVWGMVDEGHEWFGELSPTLTMQVELPDEIVWPNYTRSNPKSIPFPSGFTADPLRGGIAIADVDGDDRMEYIVTRPGQIAVFDWDGSLLWRNNIIIRLRDGADEGRDLPGTNHPGIFVINDKMGFINEDNRLVIRDAATGDLKRTFPMSTKGLEGRAQVALAANVQNGRECIVQYDMNTLEARNIDTGALLWETNQYRGFSHAPALVGDVDGDGLDEIIGVHSIDDDGSRLPAPNFPGGFNGNDVDSAVIGDINNDGSVVLVFAEQGGLNRTWCVRPSDGTILWSNNARPSQGIGSCSREIDPDKVIMGNLYNPRDRREIIARSACGREPWAINSDGSFREHIPLDDILPGDWNRGNGGSDGGIDVVSAIDWHGNLKRNQLLICKERHIEGDVGVIAPQSAHFVQRIVGAAIYVMAVDVAGDHREEIVILERNRIRVWFHNDVRSLLPRWWNSRIYALGQQNHNYYNTPSKG